MSKKNANHKQVQRQEQESAALKQIFNTFLLGLAAECYLFIVYRGYIAGSVDSLLAWDNILRVLMWLGVAALVGGSGLALVKRSDAKLRTGGIYAALAGVFFAVSGWVMTTFFDIGVTTMCTIVPVATVLMLVYFLYQRECFVNTLLLSGTLFTVWICSRGLVGQWHTLVTIGAAAVVAALAVFALLLGKIRKNGGKVYLNHKIRVLYYCRDTMRGIMKMGYMNGKWNVITMTLVPGSMGVRHFVPLAFVLSTIGLVLLTLLTRSWLFGGLLSLEWGAYSLLDFFYAYTIAKEKGMKFFPVEVILYPAFHFAYGYGSLVGIANLPKFLRAEKEKKAKEGGKKA